MKITNTEVSGFKAAFRGLRNPKMSWDRGDTRVMPNVFMPEGVPTDEYMSVVIGENDLKLAQAMLQGGSEEYKFLRMIHVSADMNMPRFWWGEFDTYKFVEKNSTSTMHKLLNNNLPITIDMFATCPEDDEFYCDVVRRLEELRKQYKEIQHTTRDQGAMDYLLLRAKRMLPEGFLQLRTIDTNYAELRNIYRQRCHHRLKEEWQDTICAWIKTLPYAKELITYGLE